MNFPAIAKQTYQALKSNIAFSSITQFVIEHLKMIKSPLERAKFVHNIIDNYNSATFSHPIVSQLSPCKIGCSGCCHTQVSITEDEAELLADKIDEGIKIDYSVLAKQVRAGNSYDEFYKLSYNDRSCIFLGSNDACQVYSERPSVCRTNAVLGEASQCSTVNGVKEGQALRLVKTEEADMVIMGAFLFSQKNGTMAQMIGQILARKASKIQKKSIPIDPDL